MELNKITEQIVGLVIEIHKALRSEWLESVHYKERLLINCNVPVFKNNIRKKNIKSFSVPLLRKYRSVRGIFIVSG
ncbi:MAG: hypothetical protein V1899_04535 [Planctomycetota bacterium]